MTQIDAKSVRFLNAVRYYGGEATITDIRKLTGLNRNEANYRFRKLEDMELITVSYGESIGDNAPPKIAELTGKARQELERGLGSATQSGLIISDDPETDEVSRERFIEMQNELERLREAQKASAWDTRTNERVTRDEFDELEEYVYDWTEVAETYLVNIRRVVERFLPVDDIETFEVDDNE